MNKKSTIFSMSKVVVSMLALFAFSGPPAMAAATPEGSAQDLIGLGTASATVNGVADPTFTQQEQKHSQPLTSTSGWTDFLRQTGRSITVEFSHPVDVQHIKITMLQSASSGIYLPRDVKFEANFQGQWYSLVTQYPSIPQSSKTTAPQTFQFDSSGIEAIAIRISFPVGVWVFARGLDVTGSTTAQGRYLPSLAYKYPPVTNTTDPQGTSYPTAFDSAGIRNMLLVETGANGSLGTWSTKDFAPMIEYVHAGYMVSPLFDTMLFLPYGNVEDTVSGWTNYMDDLFTPNQQLSALNQAVANTHSLFTPVQKEKVVLSIPYFPYGGHDFGMVDGQSVNFGGSPQDPNGTQARIAAMNWYVKTLLAKWQAADFQNLQLVGLYWNEEQIPLGQPDEQALLKVAEQTAYDNDLPLFWIPFYGANQSSQWKSLGFNAAWLQPNFMEQGANANVNRITGAVQSALANAMGIEIELTGLDSASQKLYNTFLATLHADNFYGGNVSNAVYDGSKLLLQAEQSTDPAVQSIYEQTAEFLLIR